jgi:hypothetical protein
MVMTHTDIKQIEMMLRPYMKPGEGFVDAMDRIIRERDLARYDAGRNEHAIENERAIRRMFFAACLSQPEQTLKIDPRALHMVDGPHSNEFELHESDDFAMDMKIYRVARRRPPGSTFFTQWDIDQLEKRS